MKKTALYDEHIKQKGKMVDFAGWDLPVLYTSIVEEHNATREKAGLFDVSHMGEIILRGKGSSDLLKKLIPTSLDKLYPGKAMYSCMCNEQGGVVDDIFIFMITEKEYFLVVNASTTEKDLSWIQEHNTGEVEIINVSDATSKIDIQGPETKAIMDSIFPDAGLEVIKRFHFTVINYNDSKVIISQTGYTGEFGYEMFLENKMAPVLWNQILNNGNDKGIRPVGLGARDTLRLEACYSLYGHELNDAISPVEAGLSWLVSSDDNFIARDVLINQKEGQVGRELLTFELTGKGVPRENCKVKKDGKEIGTTTSGGFSPTFKKGIGLMLIEKGILSNGDAVMIEIRGKDVPAVIVPRPFYQYNNVQAKNG